MNSEEFHKIRKPFFIHPDTLLVIFPASKHMNVSHAQWFTDMGYIFMHTVRGYYWKDEESIKVFYRLLQNKDSSLPDSAIKFQEAAEAIFDILNNYK